MPTFHYYHPIEVRYGDLDPQGHVNNAKYLTYLETARIAYIRHIGLMKGNSWLDIGIILADLHIQFRAPIQYEQKIRVGAHVVRLGNKSLNMEYLIEDETTGQVLATAASILVAYDYRRGQSIPIPDEWRQIVNQYEDLEETKNLS